MKEEILQLKKIDKKYLEFLKEIKKIKPLVGQKMATGLPYKTK